MRWFRRYNKYVPNEERVKDILKELNDGKSKGDWRAAEGVHTMLSVAIDPSGNQGVVPERGVTVKVFFHQKTGETRIYIANILARPKK